MLKKIELRYQKRAEAVKAVQREEAPKVVARVMKIPLNTLYDWLARYRNGGWHALQEGFRSGRPRKVIGPILKLLAPASNGPTRRRNMDPFSRFFNDSIIIE